MGSPRGAGLDDANAARADSESEADGGARLRAEAHTHVRGAALSLIAARAGEGCVADGGL
eukprot:9204439-Lingulodinium_polyedra.AAC.1